MIKFYKDEKTDTLFVVDTVRLQAAPFTLEDKPYYDRNALFKWWWHGDGGIPYYYKRVHGEEVQAIIEGAEEIK